EYAVPVYYLIATAEASSNLARYDGVRYGFRAEEAPTLKAMYSRTRDQGFGAEVKRRIMLGTYALSAGYYDQYYGKAQKVRTLIINDFNKAFEEVDVFIAPTNPWTALPLGASKGDPMYGEMADALVEPSSIAGLPGINVPCGLSNEGLPIGFQVIGPQFSESLILN